jgi:hypothetical protein
LTFRKNKRFEEYGIIIIVLAFSFLVVAILTHDPIFSKFGVPVEFEWVVGLFITGLSSWKLYFNPLKKRVMDSEKEIISLKSEVHSIKEDTLLIKEKLFSLTNLS